MNTQPDPERLMRLPALSCLVVCCVLLAGCPNAPTGEDPALVEAQNAAASFLHALRNHDGGSAYALLSKDYRERLPEQERNSKSMEVMLVEGKAVAEWSRGGGELSADKGRATFEDLLQTADGKQYPYRMVLVKEGGAWRVDLFTVKK